MEDKTEGLFDVLVEIFSETLMENEELLKDTEEEVQDNLKVI